MHLITILEEKHLILRLFVSLQVLQVGSHITSTIAASISLYESEAWSVSGVASQWKTTQLVCGRTKGLLGNSPHTTAEPLHAIIQ